MEIETITQTRIQIQTEIIILVQDVIMETVQVLGLLLRRVEIQIHRRLNKRHRGEIIVIRVHLQRFQRHLLTVHRHPLMAVRRVVVQRLAEVHHLVVAEVVEAEDQDKINKILTRKILSNSTFERIFSFKV